MRSWSVCALLPVLLAGPAQGYPFAQVDASPTGRLFAAIDQENPAALQSALADGASLDANNKYGHTPLVAAAAQGNAPIFRALLQAGADPNGIDANHWAPVIQAASSDQIDVMRVLLATHPNLDVQNGAGWSAISLAVSRRDKAMIELLVHAGASLNTVNEKTQHSLLTGAYLISNTYDLIPILRNAGATFANATDELFAMAAEGNIDAMRRALGAGADVNSHSSYGETPLCIAAGKAIWWLSASCFRQEQTPTS
jgi:ankyrin repeat protein